jgi:hypothetical protein
MMLKGSCCFGKMRNEKHNHSLDCLLDSVDHLSVVLELLLAGLLHHHATAE